MPAHEQKNCPRCDQGFECKVGDISNCQCGNIILTPGDREFIEERYSDCLCLNCLRELKSGHTSFREKFWVNGR